MNPQPQLNGGNTAEQASPGAATGSRTGLPAENNRRVLVIDDNRAIHADFHKILAPGTSLSVALEASEASLFGNPAAALPKIHFTVDSAFQGQEGLLMVQKAIAERRPYAMAFVDVRMPPGWDGVETTQRILEVDPNIQIVICTAYADYSWDEMFEKLGHRDGLLILKKPFDTVEALQLAHALTEKWWLHLLARRKLEELESMVSVRTRELRHVNRSLQIKIEEHEHAETMLRQSNEKFHQLADHITDAFWIRSPDMREVHYVSPAFEQIWGRSVQSLYANPLQWTDFILAEDRERVVAAFARLTGATESLDLEYRITRPAGEIRWIRVRAFQVRDAADKLIRHTGIVTDITDRKAAEAALQGSEARTKAIVESSLDCIVAMNHEGKILEFNPAAERVFGHSRAQVLGLEMAEVIIPPSLRERHRQGMRRFFATGEAHVLGKRIEITGLRSDGREFPVELAIARMGTQTPATFTGFMRDISERQQAERQLNIQYAISRVLADSSTPEQATPKILQAVGETFGWAVSALWTLDSRDTGLNCAEIWSLPDIQLDEFKTASRQITFARNIGLPGRVWASGQPAWIADISQDANFPRAVAAKAAGLNTAFAFPILEGAAVTGVIEILSREFRQPDEGLLRTFSVLGSQLGQFFQRRRLEAQLLQSQKLETVGKLAGGVAHEFNSIMTAIIGQSELLLNDLSPGNALCKNVTEIRTAADRAATLTRQLLAYGRKQILQPEILDLNSLLAGMENTLRHLIGEGPDLRIVLAAGLKAVKADVSQLEQVIMNLAMNGVHAMANQGKLTLETANVTLDQEFVGRVPELKAGHYVTLAVTDTGTGMSAEIQARLFEPFFSTKGVGQGTGLGLSTCYGIIKQSGGHIAVYSEVGRGSSFKIYLPQVELPSKPPAQRIDSPELPRGSETVLLVEDDPALRELAATLLRRLGYSVLPAANGLEALSLKDQTGIGPIHLLFTDVTMPHMNGQELAERVRRHSPATRVLFTSAYTEHAMVHQGVLIQSGSFLQKPYLPSSLARKLREVLDQTVL